MAWREAEKRRIKAFADKDAAYLFAQQTVVQLQNGAAIEGPATLRDVEVLKHCEWITQSMESNLIATVKECVRWMDTADTIGTHIHRASDANHEYGRCHYWRGGSPH